jgi:lysophospholipase L1-like esterase
MGVQSDGVLYSTQMQDWTALLAHQAFATYTQPLIQAPGCFSPFIAPLQLGRRHSGASAPGIVPADTVCALFPDITLPRNDVGIDGASTYDAHRVTPETTVVETQKRRRQYRIVLPPGKSQVTAMMMQNPTLVSVELGANEVLGVAQTGLLVPAAAYRPSNIYTYVPNSVWQPVYAQVLDSVRKTGAKAVLVGVPNVTGIVSLRSGDELWQNQAEFANFGVVINADCQGNTNLIFVPIKVATAVATARATGTAYNLSCTDAPGTQDQILTPADVTTITAVVAGMNSYIQAQASANGWAYIDIAAVLQKAVANRGPYSVAKQLGCVSPYGQYVSLDGVHPNVQGHQELANAAAEALNATYGWTIPTNPQPVLPAAQLCP